MTAIAGNVNAAIEAAKAAAANLAPSQAVVPAAAAPGAGQYAAPAAYTAPAAPMSMDDLMVGSMSVDLWLKVKEFGLIVGAGNPPELLREIVVGLDMSEVIPNYSIKYGNPAVYKKTFDRVTCATGGSWAEAVAQAQRVDPKARDYRSADLPFVALEDIKGPSGAVLAEAGKRIGHTLSTTNWREFELFYRDLAQKGLTKSVVKVKLGFLPRSNAGGNKWGVVTFQLLEVLSAPVADAAE